MGPSDFDMHRFRTDWNAVKIARPVSYSLFTFGESQLPYFLVARPEQGGETVSITQGEVRVTRPMLITPESAGPKLQNFFEDLEDEAAVQFLLARSAAFSNLKLVNQTGPARIVTDSVEEAVARLNERLDADEEDRVAILTAPARLMGLAVLRYAADRVWQSAPDNLQELRERGLLP